MRFVYLVQFGKKVEDASTRDQKFRNCIFSAQRSHKDAGENLYNT